MTQAIKNLENKFKLMQMVAEDGLREIEELKSKQTEPEKKRRNLKAERHAEMDRNFKLGTWRKPDELKKKKKVIPHLKIKTNA